MIDTAKAGLGLRRLATGLIAYGLIGVVVAAVGGVAFLGTIGRVSALSDRISGDVAGLGSVLERTSTALDDASRTASSFATTVERSGPTIDQAASSIRRIVPQLDQIRTQADAIDIFGTRPLAPLAGLFGQIATELSGLDGQLSQVASSLVANQGALVTNAGSLGVLATEVNALRARLATAQLSQGLDDARWLVLVVLALFVVWAAVPAVGALALGLWLRRLLKGSVIQPGAVSEQPR